MKCTRMPFLNFLRTNFSVLLEDVCPMRLHLWFPHHGAPPPTDVKCFSGRPKLILDAGLLTNMKLQFPGLHAHLT
jgi:hypothetical protein